MMKKSASTETRSPLASTAPFTCRGSPVSGAIGDLDADSLRFGAAPRKKLAGRDFVLPEKSVDRFRCEVARPPVVEQENATPVATEKDRARQSRGTAADDDAVVCRLMICR